MIIKKTTVLAACFMLAASLGFAQTQTREGLQNMRRSAISPIYEGNEVKGYMLFYKADKADKKNDNYGMDFYDQDLNEAKSITIQKPRNSVYLLENSYNGAVFGFYFYNAKEKELEMEVYDASLTKVASKKITTLSKMDQMLVQQEIMKGGTSESNSEGLSMRPVPGKGFIRNSFDGLGKGYNLEMYDNDLKLKWAIGSDAKSKYYETIGITEVSDKYVLATIARRNGMMSQKMDFFITAFDVETGKKVLEKSIENASAKEQLSMSSFSYDKDLQEFVVFGEYYKPTDKPMIDKSLGFFVKKFNQAGKESGSKFYAWDKDVRAKMPAAARESIEKGFINFTHNIVKGADGNTYIIAEQFKIAADGLGIAAKALGGNASVTKGVIGNMLIFVVKPDMALSEIKFYAKDKSNVELPAGMGLRSAGMLGNLMKSTGGFDYQFMQKSNDGANQSVIYVNYDKEKGESTKKVVGSLIIGSDGKITQDKIDVTSKSNSTYIYQGKPGYLMMADFMRKEKKLGMKLVKLNS